MAGGREVFTDLTLRFRFLQAGSVRRGSLLPKAGTMASMLLTQRLACSFQRNYRLLVPGKPWGSWQEPVLAEDTMQTRDSGLEASSGIKGQASQCFWGCPTVPPPPPQNGPHHHLLLFPHLSHIFCPQADSSVVGREPIHPGATQPARRWRSQQLEGPGLSPQGPLGKTSSSS